MLHKVEGYSLTMDDTTGPEMSREMTTYEVQADGLCRDDEDVERWVHQLKILRRSFPQFIVALFIPKKR